MLADAKEKIRNTIKKKVYFVRHGQTDENAVDVFQNTDTILSEEGMKQAQALAERCAKLDATCIIASDYVRAKQTAKIIAEVTGHAVEESPLFREAKRPSEVEGKTHTDEQHSQ